MTRLSSHITLEEFCRSETATRRGITNLLPVELVPAAHATAAMLERIRSHLCSQAGRDVQLFVSSGYRCPVLNRAIGSSETSDHVLALAADWTAPAFGTPTQICEHLAPLVGVLGIGQLINEYPDRCGWVHTSTRVPEKVINRILTISGRGPTVGILKA
jgi:hypothetical protein